MEKYDPDRLNFLMRVDGEIHRVEKVLPNSKEVKALKDKFFELAGQGFDRSVIAEVHENTIENYIKQRAEGFYKSFPPSYTKNELIKTFIDMEHNLRKDNFSFFALCVYKQIECCINYCLKSERLVNELKLNRRNRTYQNQNVKWDKEENRNKIYTFTHGYPVEREILNIKVKSSIAFYSNSDYDFMFNSSNIYIINELLKMDFPRKLKTILYIVKFGSTVSESRFKHDLILFESIRQARHLGAHGGIMSDTETKITENMLLDDVDNILINSLNDRYSNYLLFQGFLAEFVRNVPNY